ncbi:MAG TPA: PEP-CTERM sorting domain-containing protein [Phycisphaerae bacterium]|nr:PEP-CTERM sorting domain-containing protein [Phycisphaerae bacterium]
MKTNRIVISLVAGMVGFCASATFADVMTYNGMGLKASVTLHYSGSPANNSTISAGQVFLSYQGQSLTAYCVDILQYLGNGEVDEWSPSRLTGGNLAAYLFETHASSVTTGLAAAALQTAIWEVLYENPCNGYNPNSGVFSITNNSAVASAAQALLAGLPGSYTAADDTIVLHSCKVQDMMVFDPTPVPEPATMALLAVGALPLIRRSRRA